MPRASVIVPARDAEDTLGRTLAALHEQSLDGGFEVIVVDDGSRDGTAALARGAGERVRLVEQQPLGPAPARNHGVSVARGDVLAFCDADVFPAAGWLAAGVGALEQADIVQGKVLPDPLVALRPFDRTIWITSEVGLWETANLFVRREQFERAGGFEEWLRPRAGKALAEDVWFGWRAKRSGARSAFCAEALAYHAVFPRGWREYVGERRRLEYFPAMVARMPELRTEFLYRRMFLNQRSARFDLALAGVGTAIARRSALPLIAAVPYLRLSRAQARRGERAKSPPVPAVAAGDLAADVVGLAAMIAGTFRYGSPVL